MPIFNRYIIPDASITSHSWALFVEDSQFGYTAIVTASSGIPVVMDSAETESTHYQLIVATGEFLWAASTSSVDEEIILRDLTDSDSLWLLRVTDGQFNWTSVSTNENDTFDDMSGNIFRCLPNRLTNWVKQTIDTCGSVVCPCLGSS